jgi:hypothetical protein
VSLFISLLLKIALVAFMAWLVWTAFRPRYAVRIVVDKDGVRYSLGLPVSKQQEVVRFLEHDVEIEDRITILGNRGDDGAMHFQFRGRIHPSIQQQIRNFLVLNL